VRHLLTNTPFLTAKDKYSIVFHGQSDGQNHYNTTALCFVPLGWQAIKIKKLSLLQKSSAADWRKRTTVTCSRISKAEKKLDTT